MHEVKKVQPKETNSDTEFLKIWVVRYLPDLGAISSQVRPHIEQRLRGTISDESRQITANKIRHHLASDCGLASADTQRLLSKAGILTDSWELQNLIVHLYEIYETLIEYYEKSFIFSPILDYLHIIESEHGQLQAAELIIPKFETLMLTIGPLLRELKAVYFSSINRHLLGFMITHMQFIQRLILSHLDLNEIIWVAPYLQVLDELICMPWQNICSIASNISHNPGAISLAKRMMPKVDSISAITYRKVLQTFPHHISSQGRIQSKAVQRSSIRDLNMFQCYIWLCILEDSVSVIKTKLLPVCLQAFSLTNVRWELVIFALETLIDNIEQHLDGSEKDLFEAHANTIKELFLNATPKSNQISSLKEQLRNIDSQYSVNYTWQS